LTSNDTKKQIETTAEAYIYFFDGKDSGANEVIINIENSTGTASSNFRVSKAAGSANSYRFSSKKGDPTLATFITDNTPHGFKANDILKIEKKNGKYCFYLIEPTDANYGVLDKMIVNKQNTVIYADESDLNNEYKELNYETKVDSKGFSRNRILFGAPGTGKSFTLNQGRESLLGKDNESDYERVTFHPDYSYANFVGTYKPVPSVDSDGKDAITYEYVPGPFMRVYVDALKNSRTDNIKPYLLIIEEINRANVAAVFGDVFQLLDRGDNYVSEYPIQASEDIKKYLATELEVDPSEVSKIRIPDNMFIWATMNSADQGVFPMDTAFKRRWDFTYLGINDNDQELKGKYVYLADDKSQKVEWNKLRKAINNFLAKEKINEDKQLGPYFISKGIIVPKSGDEIDRERFINTFKNKVIMYLFEDAAKQKRAKLFEGCFQNSNRYSEICKEFEAKGVGIFNHDIQLDCEVEDIKSNDESHE
jgi:hypothetical protein